MFYFGCDWRLLPKLLTVLHCCCCELPSLDSNLAYLICKVFSKAELPSVTSFLGVAQVVWVWLNASLLPRSRGTDSLADVKRWCLIVNYWFRCSFKDTFDWRAAVITAPFQAPISLVLIVWWVFERDLTPVWGLGLSATYSSFSDATSARSSNVAVG